MKIYANTFVDFIQKTIINITNSSKIDKELINAFDRASEDNAFIKVNIDE